MHRRENPAADAFGRVFARIGKAERLLGTEPDAGDEAADDKHCHVRGEGTEDGENAEQQQVELIDETAAEPIAELPLTSRADEHTEDGGGANQSDFCAAREL